MRTETGKLVETRRRASEEAVHFQSERNHVVCIPG
jgi:hypothetical protein